MSTNANANANTITYAWTIKRLNHYYPGTFNTRRDDYIRTDHYDGKIMAVPDKGAAQRVAKALYGAPVYFLAHGEYARPDYTASRIKIDPARVTVLSETAACRLLHMDCNLPVAE